MNLYPRSFANSDEILPIDENKKHFHASLERILEIILLTFEVKATSICLKEKQQWWSKSVPSWFSLSSQPVEKLLEQGMQQRVFMEVTESALLPADYHYFASCPIYQGNTIIGLLVLLDEKERKLSELQVKALKLFVEQIKEIIFCQIQSISLEKVEESFKQVLDTPSEYIMLANPDTTITYANQSFCQLAGVPENEIIGRRWLDMMDAEKASLIATQIQQLSPKKSYFIFETTEKYQSDEKTANHIQWLNQGVFDKTGNLIQLKFVGRNTQYLRKTIDWLEENQRKLNNVLNTMINGVVVVDALGKITYVNQQVAKIFSIKIEELKGTIFSFKNWKQINEEGEELPDNQFPLVIALQKQISVENVEIGVISPTQELKWISVNASPLYDEYHRLIGAMASFIDITDKKNTQRHLQQVQKRLETITSTIEGVVWESDAQTFLFTYVSPQAKKMLGYDPEEWFVENFWANHIHPDDRDFAVEFCRSSTKQLKNHDFEYRFRKKDGNYIWLRDIVTVVAENNEPRWLRGIMVDITHQKQNQELLQKANEELSVTEEELRVSLAETLQMQKKLQETENLFRTALEASLEATYILKTKYNERGDIEDFVFQEVNYKTCQLLGLSRDELIGFGICELFPIHIELGYFERYKNVFLSQKPEEGEYYIPFLYKKSGWYYRQILPIPDGIVISSRDIDERKNLKEQLLTTSRMAKVGGWEFDLIKGEFLLSDISKEILEIENGFTLKIQSFVDFFKEGIDRERIMQALQKATIEGIPFEAEFRIATRKNETEKWVRVQAQPEVVYGRCVRLLGVLQDV
ncbi:MAG: PAS domain S-box protein, partial [Flammeovirgaceae bacterium]|nr:PAS domain S-box protein [Flammeovirgaceae bacterium]MDW8287741.1 PAS domain S-box protein [Flammeovirgaceae bacterium]